MGKNLVPTAACLKKQPLSPLCLLACRLLCLLCLAGCGSRALPLTPRNQGNTAAPHAAAPDTALAYTVAFAYAAPPAPGPSPAAAAPPVLPALRAASLLLKLQDSPPDDVQGLEFRIDKDEAEALRLLRAFGYYDGTVARALSPATPGVAPNPAGTAPAAKAAPPWHVTLTLSPGPCYTVGGSVLHYAGLPEGHYPPDAPPTLDLAGLPPGVPAESGRILRAVDNIAEILGQRGYPLAQVKDSRYAVDKSTRQLFATVLVDSGPRARMGRVRMQGTSAVSPAYLEKLQGWEHTPLWDQRMVEDYRELLTRQGLFRSIELKAVPAPHSDAPTPAQTQSMTASVTATPHDDKTPDSLLDSHTSSIQSSHGSSHAPPPRGKPAPSPTPVYDLLATVADAPQRTVGGGLNYESNRGPGVQAYWEHRNLLGQGERFRAEASLWQDSQFARATFRKPAFLDRAQELAAEGWFRHEDSIAYTQRAVWLSAGVERRLWGALYASAGVGAEGGDLQDPLHPRRGYTMTSLPLLLRYEGAGGAAELDPVRGWRGSLGVRPTWGSYAGDFTVTPTRLALSGYYPLGRMARPGGQVEDLWRVVLAARGAAGTLWRGDSHRIPASARYYGGGGGSVRGYAYQSLGPRDRHGDPLGGSSFAELSLEARVRITEDLALVPFLDGGNVYSGVSPGLETDGSSTGLRWGAGLGLRYHTAVGPLRLDVATPLNPRKDDGPVFLYISIGQSF